MRKKVPPAYLEEVFASVRRKICEYKDANVLQQNADRYLEEFIADARELCEYKDAKELQQKAERYEACYLQKRAGNIPGFDHPVYLVEALASCHCGNDFLKQIQVFQPSLLVQYIPVSLSCGAVGVPKGGFAQFPSVWENVPVVYIPGIVRK